MNWLLTARRSARRTVLASDISLFRAVSSRLTPLSEAFSVLLSSPNWEPSGEKPVKSSPERSRAHCAMLLERTGHGRLQRGDDRLQGADVGAQLRGVRRGRAIRHQGEGLLKLVESAGGKAQRDVGHHLADDAADVRLRPGGDDLALDGEVPDGRTALHAAEKAVLRAALRQAQAGDLVSLSVEVSEEDRDRDGGAVRVNVVREHDGQSLE